MNGQYHNPNDFWRQRMDLYDNDPFEKYGKRLIRFIKVVAVLLVLYLIVSLFVGCKTWKKGVSENRDSSDSVRIEYKEKIVKVPVTVYVEVPVERQMQMTNDSSHLETGFAVSDAAMIWIDGVPFLRHSLENKSQKIAKSDSVPVVEKEKVLWKTRRVTYTKTEIREKQLAWWQKGLMWIGGISIGILFIFIVNLVIKKRLQR